MKAMSWASACRIAENLSLFHSRLFDLFVLTMPGAKARKELL
jgi:hypothetical protein